MSWIKSFWFWKILILEVRPCEPSLETNFFSVDCAKSTKKKLIYAVLIVPCVK